VFRTRTRIIKHIRNFFDERGFLEVETPIISSQSGGANARPFETHLNAMKMDLKLRIAPELYLKQLIIGGFDRVYELSKVFRNEGIDATHNPEFTSIEAYQAFADFESMIKLTEDLLSSLVLEVNPHQKGSYVIPISYVNKKRARVVEDIDFKPPFKRLSYSQFLQDLFKCKDISTVSVQQMVDMCDLHHIAIDKSVPVSKSRAHLLDKLGSHFLEPLCKNPTFIMDHPIELSPLAKRNYGNPMFTERFELFVGGKELCNAYSELNDPRDQRNRFLDQVKQRDETGDLEAHEMDENFCKALEYGLPPTGGWGLGIDRLVMFLTQQTNIRDVLLFPLMKKE